MSLNNLIDKTFTAAKESARQMYADDYSKVKAVMSDKDDENAQGSPQQRDRQANEHAGQDNPSTDGEGVVFERSTATKQTAKEDKKDINETLDSIRKYAAEQTNEQIQDNTKQEETNLSTEQHTADSKKTTQSVAPSPNIYSRKDIRKKTEKEPLTTKKNTGQQEQNSADLKNTDQGNNQQLVDKPVSWLPNDRPPQEQQPTAENQESDKDLHKRLDRLESLMHLSLSSGYAQFSAHPIFHKLIHKGVPQKLAGKWFDILEEQGIDPDNQPQLFCSKLTLLIQEVLETSKAKDPANVLMFCGRSGAGKTQLVMKLSQHSSFMGSKDVAVASLNPMPQNQAYYSVLSQFCEDKGVPYFDIQSAEHVTNNLAKWSSYDHLLIDTPAIEIEGQDRMQKILALQKAIAAHTEIETHYLINTAINGNAFNDPLAAEVEADHVSLTHIDQSLKWGKTMQLTKNTDYKLRYISSGPTIGGSLIPFDPKRFAKKLIR